MPKRAKGLSAAGLKHLPPGKHADGRGLYLVVRRADTDRGRGQSRNWIFRYMRDGRARELSFGSYEPGKVSLVEARARAEAAQAVLRSGADPMEARNRVKAEAEAKRAAEAAARASADAAEHARKTLTFEAIADRLIAAHAPVWTTPKTAASWRQTLAKHAYPVIGSTPIAEIGREHVVQALSPIWTAQPATARKLQRRIAAILDYAAANGWRAADNPAAGRVLRLTKALPPMNAKGRRWPSLAWQQVPGFLATLDKQRGASPLALRFAVLSVVRSNEVREARWNEFDFGAGLWTIPGERMKGGKAKAMLPHRVPLTPPMVDVLARALALRTGHVPTTDALALHAAMLADALVFPNVNGDPLSDATLGACVKRMNEAAGAAGALPTWRDADGRPATAHGFRRSFRTWVDDERPEDGPAAERALAHDEPNRVSAAYRGGDLLARRRELMARWSAFCCASAPANITPLRAAG